MEEFKRTGGTWIMKVRTAAVLACARSCWAGCQCHAAMPSVRCRCPGIEPARAPTTVSSRACCVLQRCCAPAQVAEALLCLLLQPIGQAQGRGIFLFNKLSQVCTACLSTSALPLLKGGVHAQLLPSIAQGCLSQTEFNMNLLSSAQQVDSLILQL